MLVRDEQISFGDFVAGTRKDFFALATYLRRRWVGPAWFTIDDLEQELYLGAWKYIEKWDSKRGRSIEDYVTWNATQEAKRELHRARGVSLSGCPDHLPSNFEAVLSSIGEEGDGENLLHRVADDPIAESHIIEMQTRKDAATAALRACKTSKERFAVLAIREARSLDKAGNVLYDDFDHRIALRLGSEERADNFVMRYAKIVAQRIQDERVNPG